MILAKQILCFLFVLVLMLLAVPTSAQENLTVTVTTDKQSYSLGQTILIAVSVQQFNAPVASVVVYYELRGPQNQVITNGFGITDSTGKYVRQVTVGNDFSLGSYTADVKVSANGQTASASSAFQTIPEFTSSSGLVLIQALAFLIAVTVLTAYRRTNSAELRRQNRNAI
jgi:Tfp pilus assembly protein PilZ